MMYPPIPDQIQLTYEPTINECGERLIALSRISDKIEVYSYYYHHGYEGAVADCYLRISAAELLVNAANQLPEGFKLVVFDGWRPYQLQQSIYNKYKQRLLEEGWQDGPELREELTKFVALPSNRPDKPTPHLTGGAVDLTIADSRELLEMGTEFDDFTDKAATRYFEHLSVANTNDIRIRDNRRMLYHLMTQAGFTNYDNEWWHYDYGNLSWARQKNREAIYQGVFHFTS